MSTTKFDAEKFTGLNDFGLWRLKMKALLVQQGLADAIKSETEFVKAIAAEDKRKEMKEKAHSAIILCLSDKVLREVSKEETAAAVWTKLESFYMTKTFANRLFSKQRLYSFKIAEDKGIMDQLDDFHKIVDDLENIDVKIDDEDKAVILLNSLPKSYDQLKDAMLYGRDNTISLEEVESAFKSKELQRQNEGKHEASTRESLNVKQKQEMKGGYKKKNSQEFKRSGKEKGKGVEEKETRKCHYCKKPGHLKKDCFAFKKKQAAKDQKPDAADVADHCENGEMLNIVESPLGEDWILDSGCSFHMCPHKHWFTDLRPGNFDFVLLGNDEVCPVEGIGSIKLKVHDGTCKILTEVRFIPLLKRNLTSLGFLESKGCRFESANGVLKVIKGNNLMMRGIREQSLYYADVMAITGNFEVNSQDESLLWHARLGHVSESGLNVLLRQEILKHPRSFKVESCEQCILGKSKKQSFGTGFHTSTAPLDYAHADLWGPSKTETLGGGRYFISIMDDFSSKLGGSMIRFRFFFFKLILH